MNKKKGNPNRKGISKEEILRRNWNQREDEPKEQEQKNSYPIMSLTQLQI